MRRFKREKLPNEKTGLQCDPQFCATTSRHPMAAFRLTLLLAVLLVTGCDGAEPEPEAEPVSILSYNIWHDQADWHARLGMIVDSLREIRPDVICMQEVLQHAALPNQAYALADSLGYDAFFTSVDSIGSDRRFGNAILTRTAIEDTAWKALEPASDYRNVGYVRTTVGGRDLDVYCTHLHWVDSDSGATVRSTQIRDLVGFVDSTRTAPVALIGGDFNAEPGGAEFDPLLESFEDTYALVHGDHPRPTTLNPFIGHQERWIDYVFVERDAGVVVQDVRLILDRRADGALWASDHFGVLAKITFGPRR